MSKPEEDIRNPDIRLSAVCGLFCPACTVLIGTREEDTARFEGIAKRHQRPIDDIRCEGCRTERRSYYCREKCKMCGCAKERGVEFCGQCQDYPCDDLKAFQEETAHRIELFESQERIKEVGYEKWYIEMLEHYSCPECGVLNSAYDFKCRKCGHEPSCEYVRLHRETIEHRISMRRQRQ